jgi:hypothetical protein
LARFCDQSDGPRRDSDFLANRRCKGDLVTRTDRNLRERDQSTARAIDQIYSEVF